MLLAAGGCAAALGWDDARLPCGPTGAECAPGFSCMPEAPGLPAGCVAHGSVPADAPCVVDAMCEDGGVCYAGRCAPACAAPGAFLEPGACGPGQLCLPAPGGGRAACVMADGCLPGARCDAPHARRRGICVPMDRASSRCLPACVPSWDGPGGTYADGCAAGEVCQVMGRRGEQQLACLPGGPPTRLPGGACRNLVTEPCAPGQTCLSGICRLLCPPGGITVCDAASTCAPLPLWAAPGLAAVAGACMPLAGDTVARPAAAPDDAAAAGPGR